MSNLKFKSLFFFITISFSGHILTEISPDQMKMLEQLAPDQRESVMLKMENASALQDEIDEAFEESPSLIKRPELKDFSSEEEYCEDCIYGYNFFQFSPSTFAPSNDTPVNSSYILGPGDELEVNYYGSSDKQVTAFINREGKVILPMIGPVNFLGMTFEDARKYLNDKVKNELIGVEVNLSIKQVRSIGVWVLGEAYKPGKYVLSGLSSITNALFISGGVNEKGSLRNIQIIRNNKTIATYDFYTFLTKGSLETNEQLQDGDVIFIPFYENTVQLGGAFKRPDKYEFIQGETIQDAVALAGGFNSEVMPDARLELSSVDRELSKRKITYLNPFEDLNTELINGDVINISSTSGLTPQTIELSGEVVNPGAYSIQPGDTILDIINRAGGYTEEAYFQGAVFLREEVAESQKIAFERSADQLENTIVDIISKDIISEITEFTLTPISALITRLRQEEPLGRMVVNLDYLELKTNPVTNFTVKDKDTLYIPKRPSFVSVVGEVLNTTSVGFNPRMGVDEYIQSSGGLNDTADKNKIFIILPNGQSELLNRSLFSSKNTIMPGSTIVISRDSRPFDAVNLTQIITPILADLATSAAAIAAISD
jgi:polysaccharide export outer membrane protein